MHECICHITASLSPLEVFHPLECDHRQRYRYYAVGRQGTTNSGIDYTLHAYSMFAYTQIIMFDNEHKLKHLLNGSRCKVQLFF